MHLRNADRNEDDVITLQVFLYLTVCHLGQDTGTHSGCYHNKNLRFIFTDIHLSLTPF